MRIITNSPKKTLIMPTEERKQKVNRVTGRVTDSNGLPLAGLKVEIHDVDMREWQLLADTATDRRGAYNLHWSHDQLKGREKGTADIAVRVLAPAKDTELFKSSIDEVRFNAGNHEEINIVISDAIPQEQAEYDRLLRDVTFLAGRVAIADLKEDGELRDITFLSRELDVPARKIEHLVVAHRIQKMAQIDPAFFYALLRKDTLLQNDFSRSLNARVQIGVGDDETTILYDAALTDREKIEADIKAAVKEEILAPEVAKNAARNIKILHSFREKAESYYEKEHTRKIIDMLTTALSGEKIGEMGRLFEEHRHDPLAFFDKITDIRFSDDRENGDGKKDKRKKGDGKKDERKKGAGKNVTGKKTGEALGRLVGFGNEVMPHLIKTRDIKKPQDIKKLAGLNKADWAGEIKKANPGLKDNKLIDSYASVIVRKFEKEYPTLAFTAQLEREKKTVFNNQSGILEFLTSHDDLDLTSTNIDLYLKKKRVPKKTSGAIREELKSVQRVFRLVPSYSKTLALRNENIHSAHSIVSTGETRFLRDVGPRAGLSEAEAREVYRRAETRHTGAMLFAGELRDSMSVVDIPAFETDSLALKLKSVAEDFPNLKSLFKGIDTCECEHCRSVYSPAAYLVEILEFLSNRSVTAGNARSTLFSRRPDLGEIDLSCANAHTPVPYIDLVCELLEEVIAPDQGIDFSGNLSDGADPLTGIISNILLTTLTGEGLPVTDKAVIYETDGGLLSSAALPHYLRDKRVVCKIVNTGGNNYKVFRLRQTLSAAKELDAAPEYINMEAYEELKASRLAFILPFDLHHTEAAELFKRFDISRSELMQAFQVAGDPSDGVIAAENLGLTDAESAIITTTPSPNNNAAQQEFWNVPAPGNVTDHLVNVGHFLDRTGLTYKELDLLLKLEFIDPSANLFIRHNDLTCDTSEKVIANLHLDALDRIHRFLRLLKKTGWKPEVLDAVITQQRLGNGQLDEDCLIMFSRLTDISRETGIKPDELIGFYGEFPHTILDEKGPWPLYQHLFLNKGKNGTVLEEFSPENIDGSQPIASFTSYIATCLQLKSRDLEFLLPLLPDGDLTFSNLSYLFAASRLAKRLRLKAEDLSILAGLAGIDFTASPQETLRFIKKAGDFKNSPLNASDTSYILNHEATNLDDRQISEEGIEEFLNNLKEEYENVTAANLSPFDDDLGAEEQLGALEDILSVLEGAEETDVKTITGFADRQWTSLAAAKQFIDDLFDERIDRTEINAALDGLDSVAPGADAGAEQKEFVRALMDSISAFFTGQDKLEALTELVAETFKTDPSIAGSILNFAELRQPAPGSGNISVLLADDFDNPVTPAGYPDQYGAVRLLSKMFVIINGFNPMSTDLDWYLQNSGAMGWFEIDGIPWEPGQAAVDFDSYLGFFKALSYNSRWTPAADPADAGNPVTFLGIMEMLLPGNLTGRDEIMRAFALLTGYEKDGLDAIDAHLFPVFDAANYRDPGSLDRLFEAAELAHKLTATAAQVIGYIKPVLTPGDVEELRATLKSRYDEDTWLNTLKQVMDAVRPRKRDALVTYILATNPDLKDENGLFDHFLVDVKVEACFPSSRIVQAHNSIQVFVQRCLMGMEPGAIADTENDPNWNQWQWMKNYRVWEANRKVFLYPENWYDVTLADDKSFQLEEFMSDLQQNELTGDTAEVALRAYLEKLDNIAFLEVKASWYDTATMNMHVFARTKGGDPPIWYYRRFEKERHWTAWEKVELDISGDHLLAFGRNNRLHLAWPVFSEIPDPGQGAQLPDQGNPNEQLLNQQRKQLKIQLALSEYSNNRWLPKRVSNDAVLTPSAPVIDSSLPRKGDFNLIYYEQVSTVIIFSSYWDGQEYHQMNGMFNIAGCKGYPELLFQGNSFFPDFYPDFRESPLKTQRYRENPSRSLDDLSVRTGISLFNFYQVLNRTPGLFRITYPHQITIIDMIALLFQVFLMNLHGGNSIRGRSGLKMPLGTLLPYFKEDSNHAWVIIPGFYKKVRTGSSAASPLEFDDSEKRTASDVFRLIKDITSWVKKVGADFESNPPADSDEAIERIISDPDFHDILMEISRYEAFDFILNFLIGKTGNDEFDAMLEELRAEQGLVYGEQFKNLYHPLVCALRKVLYRDGVRGLMRRETQLDETGFDFETHYQPNINIVPKSFIKNHDGTLTPTYPLEDVDFSSDGSYSLYNWDLFFRAPLHIAASLTTHQRFEEALTWFHYMFNPTGALSGTGAQKFWVTKPFYLNQETDYIAQRIDTLIYDVSGSADPQRIRDLEFAIGQWREKPFRPDVIARFRPVAYQKAVLMKYIDNLTEWGDNLFRQETMESVAQATQMYIIADKLLGPKPRIVPAVVNPPAQTYNQMEAGIDSFGNALVELENILPDITALPEGGAELPPPPVTLSMLYFCVPHNEKMMEYWNRIEERLTNIRNCRNIDGIEMSLALFAPPIDPGMLVRAAAAGLDISSIIAGMNAPLPNYRFSVISRKATELAQEVRSLGSSLLQALEKKDGEDLSLLRNDLALKVLDAVTDLKKLQIDEAKEQIGVLQLSRKVTEENLAFYSEIEKISQYEQAAYDKQKKSKDYKATAQEVKLAVSIISLLPDIDLGASGFGGTPLAKFKIGGINLGQAVSAASDILNFLSLIAANEAAGLTTKAGWERRYDDWKLKGRLAEKEVELIDQRILAAEIKKNIAETELRNHELQIENAKKTDEFMRSKYTNNQLYNWMISQISSVYFKSYKLAHDFAKKAERCYRYELGNDDTFISFGYWDNMKKGLLSANSLIHDLKRMETAWLDKNRREYEITKHVSVAQLDPLALINLRASGSCDFEIPEVVFDMDHPGHFFRRIKSVSVSIPCTAGPHVSVSARLSLVSNRYRKVTGADNIAGTGYTEDPGNDERFVYNVGSIQSIATSNAQDDSGMFELSFRDERYLPFEGTGAISRWRLELPTAINQFDYDTISDVIVHVKYTAREGGFNLKSLAEAALNDRLESIRQWLNQGGLNREGLHVALNMRHDMAEDWNVLKLNGTADLTIDLSRLPYMAQSPDAEIDNVLFVARVEGNPATFTVNVDGAAVNLARIDDLGLCSGTSNDIGLGTMFALSVAEPGNLLDLMMLVNYRF